MVDRDAQQQSSAPANGAAVSEPAPGNILVIDIGGSKVKILATGQTEPRKVRSGKGLRPARMVEAVLEQAADWEYDGISIGYPGLVGDHGPRSEPGNLGPGWVGFNYAAAFGRPVRILNDAAMQALGSYDGGRMLFLGLGTGLGSALIAENVIVPLELGQLMHRDGKTLGEVVGRRGLERQGLKAWRIAVKEIVGTLMGAFAADYVVLGGGNAKHLRQMPPGTRLGNNLTAFRGGFRLWKLEDIRTQNVDGLHPATPPAVGEWRLI
jgi:predicted NBD/HSP70 family sugar kinase